MPPTCISAWHSGSSRRNKTFTRGNAVQAGVIDDAADDDDDDDDDDVESNGVVFRGGEYGKSDHPFRKTKYLCCIGVTNPSCKLTSAVAARSSGASSPNRSKDWWRRARALFCNTCSMVGYVTKSCHDSGNGC